MVKYVQHTLTTSEDILDTVKHKASHTWHVDEFTRRGHYRTYKSGKRVWVKSSKVVTGSNSGIKKDKYYKL